jgi:hypothetical protein
MAVEQTFSPHLLRSVEARPGYKLTVSWERGPQATIDFSETIQKGGVFAALKSPRVFAKVRIDPTRRKIEWPEPSARFGEPLIDIDAESLFEMAGEQRTTSLLHRLWSLFHSMDKAKAKGFWDFLMKTD